MASKFAEFLGTHKIDPRRLAAASVRIERLRPEDRTLRLRQRQARSAETKPEGGEKPAKPRSGKPVTPQGMARALAGEPLAGPAKTRLLRAVNQILGQKKKDPVDLRALF